MNEKQKTFLLTGLLLFLFSILYNFMFVQKNKNELTEARYQAEIDQFKESITDSLVDNSDMKMNQDNIYVLGKKYLLAKILQYIFIFIAVSLIITAIFVRNIKTESDIEEDWEEEDWEED